MTPRELLNKAQALGVSIQVDGPELVVRYEGGLPDYLIEQLRLHKPELLTLLAPVPEEESNLDPVACRGCAAVTQAGTTLCAECGSERSPLVRQAVELIELAHERTLRGRALLALDKRHYPRLRLPNAEIIGPGLLAWCPVLREADESVLRAIVAIAGKASTIAEVAEEAGVQQPLEDKRGALL